jgi:hypothetical protein
MKTYTELAHGVGAARVVTSPLVAAVVLPILHHNGKYIT